MQHSPAPPSARPQFSELTHRGTRIAGGQIFEDPNPDFRSVWELQEIYGEMIATDQTLYGLTGMIADAAAPMRVLVAPASETNEARRLAGFVEWMLGQMARPLAHILQDFLDYGPRGFRYGEVIWGVEAVRSGAYRGSRRVVVRDVLPCDQLAHDQWKLDPTGSHLVGITQLPPWGGYRSMGVANGWSPRVVPASKLFLLTHRGRGLNFEGIGMLRPCIQWWRLKNLLSDSMAIANERWAVPVIVVEVDRERASELGYSHEQIDTQIDAAAGVAEDYAGGRSKVLKQHPGVKFSTFGGHEKVDSRQVIEGIREANRQMAMAFAASFAPIGVGETGNRNVIEVHRKVHQRAVSSLMDHALREWERQVLRPAVAYNFGVEALDICPRLTHQGIDDGLLDGSLGVLLSLVQAGVIKPTLAMRSLVYRELSPSQAEALITADEQAPDAPPDMSVGAPVPGPGRPRED